jgi:hypothetical protein
VEGHSSSCRVLALHVQSLQKQTSKQTNKIRSEISLSWAQDIDPQTGGFKIWIEINQLCGLREVSWPLSTLLCSPVESHRLLWGLSEQYIKGENPQGFHIICIALCCSELSVQLCGPVFGPACLIFIIYKCLPHTGACFQCWLHGGQWVLTRCNTVGLLLLYSCTYSYNKQLRG